ncbi:McrC family protein [Hymenobacter sp. B81]|uniref:McrC family protein n=1 Tax=Hymenobacter sp. B81 TaxID=3344878 RepID=UPI0037DCF41E
MSATSVCITAFEHQTLSIGRTPGLLVSHLEALDELQQRQQAAWFTRVHRGIKLSQFVGLLQVPGLTLEILPKTDRTTSAGAPLFWRKVLLQLLRVVHDLPLSIPDVAQLAQTPRAMLDLFVAALLQEVNALLRQGLARHYHPTEANRPALRGQLLFSQQIQHNLIRRDRFFTRQQNYDAVHPLNCLLRMALEVAARQVQSPALAAQTRTALLHWPELPRVPVPAMLPPLTRQTERYRRAAELALMLLREYSPDLAAGPTEGLSLLLDMNTLFERYVARVLQRAGVAQGVHVQAQAVKSLWGRSSLKPDLVVTLPSPSGNRVFVLDTKWKVPGASPEPDDIRQLYAYCHIWQAQHGLLLYPHSSHGPAPRSHTFVASGFMPHTAIFGHSYFAELLNSKGQLNTRLGHDLLQALTKLN